jgi:uncharacterized membrane protein YfcA
MIAVIFLMSRRRGQSAGIDAAAGSSRPGRPTRLAAAHVLMVAAGFYGGFIQAGVGFILMAILYRVLGLDLVRVNMHKVFIVGVYTIPAIVVFALHDDVIWRTGLILAAGNAIGGWIGSHVAVKRGERMIRLVLYAALIAMAVRLLTLPG